MKIDQIYNNRKKNKAKIAEGTPYLKLPIKKSRKGTYQKQT